MLVIVIASLFSFVGILSIMVSYLSVREFQRNTAMKIIFQLACSDLYYIIVGFFNAYINYYITTYDCQIIGFFSQHASLVNPTWVFAFAYVLYGFYSKKYTSSVTIRRKLPQLIAACWLIPAFIALIPMFIDNGYGYSFLYCWISETLPIGEKLALMGALLYLPMYIEIGFIITYFYKIHYSITHTDVAMNDSRKLIQ